MYSHTTHCLRMCATFWHPIYNMCDFLTPYIQYARLSHTLYRTCATFWHSWDVSLVPRYAWVLIVNPMGWTLVENVLEIISRFCATLLQSAVSGNRTCFNTRFSDYSHTTIIRCVAFCLGDAEETAVCCCVSRYVGCPKVAHIESRKCYQYNMTPYLSAQLVAERAGM